MTARAGRPAASLEDLASPRFRGKLLLQDPRTPARGWASCCGPSPCTGNTGRSTGGAWLRNILTVTDGWDSAYGMFTSGEAPLVLSYTTSPLPSGVRAKRALSGGAVPEGHYAQVEGVGILKGARHPELARAFIDYMLAKPSSASFRSPTGCTR